MAPEAPAEYVHRMSSAAVLYLFPSIQRDGKRRMSQKRTIWNEWTDLWIDRVICGRCKIREGSESGLDGSENVDNRCKGSESWVRHVDGGGGVGSLEIGRWFRASFYNLITPAITIQTQALVHL